MFQKIPAKILFVFIFFSLIFAASAQTRRRTTKGTVKKTAATKPIAAEQSPVAPVKKNERPAADDRESAPAENDKKSNSRNSKSNSRSAAETENKSVYFYEFSQPDFNVSQIRIEHDENGKGKITFSKRDFSEALTDPLQLSAATLEKVKAAWQTLNFLDSTENYQYEKDYSHLGNMTFTTRKDGRERVAKFNYTTDKDAKNLSDEYRRIWQQHIWTFDIKVARENYPLETPALMDALDSLIKRNEISDAAQMSAFLQELAVDERLPLIARNHAARIVKAIEKKKE